ncbi:MAG: hypothetical protein AAF183_02430 [Pseudomonadota bacterium]
MSAAARSRGSLVSLAIVAAALLVWAGLATQVQLSVLDIAMQDNGDGHRVLDKAFVSREFAVFGSVPATDYPMMPLAETLTRRLIPDSLSGLIALITGTVAKLAGWERVSLLTLPYLYHLVYALGALLLIRTLTGRAAQIATGGVLVLVLVCPLTLGLFASFYEEAAVIAGMPLWTALALRIHRGPSTGILFALATVAMIYAKPAVLLFVLPAVAVIWATGAPGRWRLVATGLLIFACVIGLARNSIRYGDFNGFNRLHNGVAYSLAGVSGWEARAFGERLEERLVRVDPETAVSLGLGSDIVDRWGQSYWPDLVDVDWRERERLAEAGMLSPFLGIVLRAPEILWRSAAESCLTAFRADYRLSYLLVGEWPPITSAILSRLGWVFAVFTLGFAAAVTTRSWLSALFLLPTVLAPLFVVLADGYYEYEKHLIPYLVPGIIAALGAWQLRRKKTL